MQNKRLIDRAMDTVMVLLGVTTLVVLVWSFFHML